ncbi:MAG TPA: SH3 domain-containing protein, partial [Thermomicrobiales bacterium]|nr:SH3 domain-containing protein [Thermomicrobiales bacterium]
TVFRVPSGSTVQLQGQAQNGYVSAEFMWMYGWLPLWSVVPAAPVAAETATATPDPNLDLKTPQPGSGFAFTTVDLAMRAGPSANDDPMTTIPAGTKVTLTGVWQNGFQRVTYGDQVGWVSNEFLQTPTDPTPATKANGKPQYSHDQIVKIIYAAADRYGQSRDAMLRVATCESNLDPYAVNPSGSYGLFQFIRSTWQSTPYGNQDIFDPKANANAAGWMWSQGRQAEWVCK